MNTILRTPALTATDVHHCGVLVPWANQVMEQELPQLTARRITWHVARLVPLCRTTTLDDEFLADMHRAIPRALDDLVALHLKLVFFGCTSASFTHPVRVDRPPDEPAVIDAFQAIVQQLTHLRAQKVQLLTPYEQHLTALEAAALETAGLRVTTSSSLGKTDNFHTITTSELLQQADRLDPADDTFDALVISCTNLHTLDAIRSLQHRIGKPVISSNTAIAAVAQRLVQLP